MSLLEPATRVRLVAEDGEIEATCTLAELYEANEMLEDERGECERALSDCGVWTLGGGAAPRVRVELVLWIREP